MKLKPILTLASILIAVTAWAEPPPQVSFYKRPIPLHASGKRSPDQALELSGRNAGSGLFSGYVLCFQYGCGGQIIARHEAFEEYVPKLGDVGLGLPS